MKKKLLSFLNYFRDEKRFLGILLALTLLSRIGYILTLDNTIPTGADATLYHYYAQNILSQHSYPPSGRMHVYTPTPLYPFFLAVIYFFSQSNFFLVKVIQALLNAATAGIIYLIARRIFNPTVAKLSVIFFLFFPYFIFFVGGVQTETLYMFLLALGVLWLVIFFDEKKDRVLFYAGITFGLAILCRPGILMFCPFIALWLFLRKVNIKNRILQICVFSISVGCIILPCTLRNYVKHREFNLVTDGSGAVFFASNNDMTLRRFSTHDAAEWEKLDKSLFQYIYEKQGKMQAEGLTIGQQEAIWYRMGFDFIKGNPKGWIWLMCLKFARLWAPFVNPLTYSLPKVFVSLIFTGSIMFLGLLGLVKCIRSKDVFLEIPLLFIFLVIAVTILHVLFFIPSVRLRTANVDLFLLIFASYYVVRILSKRKSMTSN